LFGVVWCFVFKNKDPAHETFVSLFSFHCFLFIVLFSFVFIVLFSPIKQLQP